MKKSIKLGVNVYFLSYATTYSFLLRSVSISLNKEIDFLIKNKNRTQIANDITTFLLVCKIKVLVSFNHMTLLPCKTSRKMNIYHQNNIQHNVQIDTSLFIWPRENML